MKFIDQLNTAWTLQNSLLCVGLDPDRQLMPPGMADTPTGIYDFCTQIVDSCAEYACAFKPQIAHFAALAAESQLVDIIGYIKQKYPHLVVILDAKRGDIGSTAEKYAEEAFVRYQADAVTLSPFLGLDSLQPWQKWSDKGLILLCRTSNPGGKDLQLLNVRTDSGEQALYQYLAAKISHEWNSTGQCGLVVGATFPEELKNVRQIVGDMPLLVPGVGAQGGDVASTVKFGCCANQRGLIINSSRAVLYASNGSDFATKAAQVAKETRDLINQYRSN